jgi:hypothetical protein
MDPDSQTIADRLLDVVANIPSSQEPPAIDPRARALVIARKAARRAGAVSGALSLPVGPVGLLTVLPDLVMTWRIQAQMVADIAAAFGKSQMLTREQLIYCLFEHGSAQSLRDFVTRVGERYVVRRATLRTFRTAATRIGVKVARRSAGRSAARFLPLVGAAGVAFYAYRDTLHVHRTAVALFEGEAVMADEFV